MKQFVQEFRSGFKIIRQGTMLAEELLQGLMPNPDLLFNEAIILKPGSRTHAGVIMIGGKRYLLKRYNCRGFKYRFLNAFRCSRAFRVWQVAWEFRMRGLPVPIPYIVLEERHFRLLGRSYLLMEYAEGAETLDHVWMKLDRAEKRTLLFHMGQILGRVHRSGCLHGDLKWSNIMIQPENLNAVMLVDLDGSRITSASNYGRSEKDVARFVRNLEAKCSDNDLKSLFLSAWKQSFRVP